MNVDFSVDLIDPMYINAAIYEMNGKTEQAMFALSKHISDLYTFIDGVHGLLSTYQPVELIGYMTAAKPSIDWPAVPQMLPVEEHDCNAKRKKNKQGDDTDVRHLIAEMRRSVRGMPQGQVSAIPEPVDTTTYALSALEAQITSGKQVLDLLENFQLKNIFTYGRWLLLARDSFQDAKSKGTLAFWSNNFVDWVQDRCCVKKSRAYDYMKFVEIFSAFPGVLNCQLPFLWFKTNGKRICDYLHANTTEGNFWKTL